MNFITSENVEYIIFVPPVINHFHSMKYFIILIFLSVFGLPSTGQGLSELSLPGIDSLKTPQAGRPDAALTVPFLSPVLPFFPGDTPPALEIPAFDISRYLNNGKLVSQYSIDPGMASVNGYSLFLSPSPFFHSGTVFNQAVYRLNEKFTLGGNSFGVNSLFSAPLPRRGGNQWETRGASMFMQYKVNKNFRIETRISVTGNSYYP